MSSLISLELYVGIKTPLGWIIFLIKFNEDFIRIWILKILRPQLDEPEQPPTSIRKRKRRVVNDPQTLKSYVLNPLPVDIEVTANAEILKDWKKSTS